MRCGWEIQTGTPAREERPVPHTEIETGCRLLSKISQQGGSHRPPDSEILSSSHTSISPLPCQTTFTNPHQGQHRAS